MDDRVDLYLNDEFDCVNSVPSSSVPLVGDFIVSDNKEYEVIRRSWEYYSSYRNCRIFTKDTSYKVGDP